MQCISTRELHNKMSVLLWQYLLFPYPFMFSTLMFTKTGCSKGKWEDLKFYCRHVTSVNVYWKLLFSLLCLFMFLLFFCPLLRSLSLSLSLHTQTQTNTAVTVAYYSGQVRARRWGLLNAGATVHQCLRNRGTCCDHRWRLAIYTCTYTRTYTHCLMRKYVINVNRHTLLVPKLQAHSPGS